MVTPPVEMIQSATVYNRTTRKTLPALQLTIIPSRYSDPKNLSFTYNITSYTKTSLEIKLNFDNPAIVSSLAEPDRLQI